MPKYQKDKRDYDYARSERVGWLDNFAENYGNSQKNAVEVARHRQEISLSDRINAIFNQNTGHRTVEGIVKEYQERTGLNEYLRRVSNEQQRSKTASHEVLENLDPHLKDRVISYINNVIDNNHGYCTIPAVQHDVLSTFSHEGLKTSDILNDKFATFVNNIITEVQSRNSQIDSGQQQLGKGVGVVDVDDKDSENSDFLSSITTNI